MDFDFEHLEELRRMNLQKKWLPCLGWCGKKFLTDAGHRFCPKCTVTQARLRRDFVPREIPVVDISPSDLPESLLAT